MTTKTEQDVRYWPTLKGLLVLARTEHDAAEADPCPPECERTGMCVRSCPPLPLPLED